MRRLIAGSMVLLAVSTAAGQPRQLQPSEPFPTIQVADMRLHAETGAPVAIYGTDYVAPGGTPEEMARAWLRDRGPVSGIDPLEMAHRVTTRTPGGTRVRFTQVKDGIAVYQSEVAVSLDHRGRVVFVSNGFKPGLLVRTAAFKRSPEASVSTARGYLGVLKAPATERVSTVIYANGSRPRVVHQVRVRDQSQLNGDWEVLVDAETGEVVKAVDRAFRFEHGDTPRRRRVDGSGWVFNPDPLSSSGSVYGGAYGDNDDADTPELTAELQEVTLRDITFDGATYSLEGPWVTIKDLEAPNDGVFSQSTPEWHNTRSHDAFEAVNAYFHIDRSLRYINDTLGFQVRPYQYTEGVWVDPHAADGDDNSYYSGSDGSLQFGEGGVDDAEDADVLLHELGHGIHDWITSGSLSQVEGLSEGVGDYWANSASRSTGLWDVGEDQRAWVFHWDGHNEYFAGRTTDYGAHYPDGLVDQIHQDGQIFASALMEMWEQLGRETTDRLFLEGLSMTSEVSGQVDAAFAIMQADSVLFGGANGDVIRDVFNRRGYLLRASFAAVPRAGPSPLTVDFLDSSFSVGSGIQSWAWDLDGDGTVDSNEQRPSFTYETPGLYTVTLTVSDGQGEVSHTLEDYVSVNGGVYLWQGGPDQMDRSGAYLRNHFLLRGLTNAYAESEEVHRPLTGYDAVFLSLGNYESGPTEMTASMASALIQYVEGGGRLYVDGSEALGWDRRDDEAMHAMFGLSSADDGTGDATPIMNMQGHSGTIGEGMVFSGTSQLGLSWIDRFEVVAPAVPVFTEGSYGTVAVQHELPGGGKTFVLSYSLGLLEDGDSPSSREELLDRILVFFEIDAPTAVDADELPDGPGLDAVFPNPAAGRVAVRYRVSRPGPVTLSVYDALGRRVAILEHDEARSAGVHDRTHDLSFLSSGSYVLVMDAAGIRDRQHLVIVR